MSQVRSGNMWCPMRGGWIFFALYVDYVHDLQFKNSIQWKLAYHIPKYLPLSDYNCLYSVLIDWITNNLSCPRKKSVLLRQYCYGVYSGNYGSFLAPFTRWKHCDEKAGNSSRWGTHELNWILFNISTTTTYIQTYNTVNAVKIYMTAALSCYTL